LCFDVALELHELAALGLVQRGHGGYEHLCSAQLQKEIVDINFFIAHDAPC
jgi:hypothetical protein